MRETAIIRDIRQVCGISEKEPLQDIYMRIVQDYNIGVLEKQVLTEILTCIMLESDFTQEHKIAFHKFMNDKEVLKFEYCILTGKPYAK